MSVELLGPRQKTRGMKWNKIECRQSMLEVRTSVETATTRLRDIHSMPSITAIMILRRVMADGN
jgi:hypothetical protein